jgi:hypothetical protein
MAEKKKRTTQGRFTTADEASHASGELQAIYVYYVAVNTTR